eukprot:CAMPEP_0174262424 /NCGR_PEP_ID=MMETSP0439-20130205/12966_1 /TAXON_ID=0 /ORGANISM="Stereomyxa ramosa, Strain Chinc5" /LENGTH=344 /DNA_ID=CAMNT_0015347129 /DNA_START=373 /DNA_END=1407 /DNA_ORIENTATION=-
MKLLMDSDRAIAAVMPLKEAMEKLTPESETLTPLHADFVQVCLLSKTYRAALPVVREDLTQIVNPKRFDFHHTDLLRYFYYGGMVFVGVKDFKRALEFFKQGFTVSAAVLSAIMVECYKKHILVSLLLFGHVKPVPKYTSSLVQRHLKSLCPQYQELVNAFSTNSTDEVHKVAAQHSDAFQKDNNFGLVKQCIQSLYRRNIKRHTRTYLTLSLEHIAESVRLESPKEAESYILSMIDKGEIFATINQKDGMVSFGEDPEEYNDNAMLEHLDKQIKKNMGIAHKLRHVDHTIACSEVYLSKTTMQDRHGRWEMEDFEMSVPPGLRGPGRRKGRKGKGKKGMHTAN